MSPEQARNKGPKYPEKTRRIRDEIKNIFAEGPNAYPGNGIVAQYERYSPAKYMADYKDQHGEDNREDMWYTVPTGKLLVQYQPARSCKEKAKFKLWLEGVERFSAEWKPLPGQIYVAPGQQQQQQLEEACPVNDHCGATTCDDDSCVGPDGDDDLSKDEGVGGENIDTSVPRPRVLAPQPRKAPKRVSEPAPGTWASPENYANADPAVFIRGEVARSWDWATSVRFTGGQTTSKVNRWAGEVTQIAVEGLYGCTAILVVSAKGAVAFHIWEEPTFALWDTKRKVDIPADPAVYKKTAEDALRRRDPKYVFHQAGIYNLRTQSPNYQPAPAVRSDWSDMLNNEYNPVVWKSCAQYILCWIES